VIERVGILGVGHLAGYLVEGLARARPELEVVLSPRNVHRTAQLAAVFAASVAADNQAVSEAADVVLVTTRPADVAGVCRAIAFRAGQTVISTAAGVPLSALASDVAPATAVRAMPLTCSAIGRSPTLLLPDDPIARELFEHLGTVHCVEDEAQFNAASAIAAYYGWIFALMDEAVAWCTGAGVPRSTARGLVLETTRGAAQMGLLHPERELSDLLESLATPGGVTRQGLETLERRGSLGAWIEALEEVLQRLRGEAQGKG
jgi:pyrroline-5-carboxylate reductase